MGSRKGKKSNKKASRPRKGRKQNRSGNVPEWASLSETRTITPPEGGFVLNQMYSLMNTSLDQYARATRVAGAYQFYRIRHVSLKLKPPADSYVSGSTVGTAKPYLYYMLDKAGAIPTNITLEGLKQMGAKPRAFDEKQLLIKWSPSVLQDAMVSGGAAPVSQGSAYKVSPWLNTNNVSVGQPWNPSTVDHLGVYWMVAAAVIGTGPAFDIEVEVQFEFKKPLIIVASSSTTAVPVQVAKLDASPDGIEGGVDGITIPLSH